MPLFPTKITIPKQWEPDHMIIRKSRYVYYLILWGMVIASAILLFALVWASINVDPSSPWPLWWMFSLIIWWVVIVSQLLIRGFIIGLLIWYFYSITVVTSDYIIKLTYKLNLRETTTSADIDGIISIDSNQSWFLQSTLNYWDIVLKLENNSNVVINNIPNPKALVKKIYTLKDQ